LEELKQQALAAQKFREQKEEERRRRIDELRQRDNDRRHQVEERKRQIWEAERDRREAILRKNQEREARIDSKRKNERSSIVFAFGSSTPRMPESTDSGGSFWGSRRATSTTNVMMFTAAPLTRRSSERELDGSKKRATSASGLDRKPGEGEDGDVLAPGTAASLAAQQRVHRRKTDLMPTIPSPRDLTPTSSSRPSSVHLQGNRPFSRSPGRAYSMSRLDQLSQPRRRPAKLHEKTPDPAILGSSPTTAKSMSRSMSHLAGSRQSQRGSQLHRSDASRSMSQLTGSGQGYPVPPTRSTRAERLRQRNRRFVTGSAGHLQGLRSGEVTPSRPLSALSQQSVNSVNSGVSVRARPVAAPRRPRPFSIAVTGVTHEPDSQASRTSHRHSIAGEIRTSKSQNLNTDHESAKPPLPKVHTAKKLPKSETPGKKTADKVMKPAKASPRMTPKTTPLQSPGSEVPPSLSQDPAESREEKNLIEIEKTEDVSVAKPNDQPEQVHNIVEQTGVEIQPSSEEICLMAVESEPIIEKQVHEEVNENEILQSDHDVVQEEIQEKLETAEHSEHSGSEVDMTASMIATIRITTEEEAKAALAERRRLAREKAEREAELEKQRLEEEQRLERERLHREEEEQHKFEEEQLRLGEEARQAEEERLLQAIQENERREEEERKRREEEAKAKAEKEEAEKKAREEAERMRHEMNERLKKEEEERIARRKRVEAIMLRTRGKGSTPSNTPTKDERDDEEGKEESPLVEKLHGEAAAAMQLSGEDILVDSFSTNIMDHIQENGGSGKKLSSSSSSDLLLMDNMKPMETSEDLTSATSILPSPSQRNGHQYGMEYDAVDFANVDNVKQNNATNNLLDFSQFNAFSTNNVMLNDTQQSTAATEFEQILDLGSVPSTGKLSNEDNINSNVTNNGPSPPFIAFQENTAKKTDSNSVTDLLS